MPTAWLIQSKRFRYIVMISFLEYLFSNSIATTHSLSFCFILPKPEEVFPVNNILESCWETECDKIKKYIFFWNFWGMGPAFPYLGILGLIFAFEGNVAISLPLHILWFWLRTFWKERNQKKLKMKKYCLIISRNVS